jgi:hypothetical protein
MKPFARRQRGSGLLEIALVVLLVAAAIAAGFVFLKAQVPPRQAQAQEQALDWADQAIVAFAASYGRLPCPASTPGGTEDCSGSGKGWLPVAALEDVQPRLDMDAPGRGALPMRYVVYRNSKADLAVAANHYEPWQWDDDNSKDGTWAFGAINGLDFCTALGTATAAGYDASLAHSENPDGSATNIAYGIAAAGATAGTTGRFDGANADSSTGIEAPSRQADSDYDDRVRVRDFATLGQSMSCDVTLASVEAVGRSSNVTATAQDQQEGNADDAKAGILTAAMTMLLQGADVTVTIGEIVSSTVSIGTYSAELSAAIVACALPPWVQCALIPVFTAAEAEGVSALATAFGVIGVNASAFAATAVAMGMMIDAAVKAGAGDTANQYAGQLGGAVDQKTLDAVCDSVDPLQNDADKAEADYNKKDRDEKAAEARYDVIIGNVQKPADATRLDEALTAYATAKQKLGDATSATSEAQDALDALDTANGGGCTDSTYCVGDLAGKSFDSLDQQCKADGNDPASVSCLAVANMLEKRAVAQSALDRATANETAARAVATQAATIYGNAYGALPASSESCQQGVFALSCPSIVVDRLADKLNQNFSTGTYCTGDGGTNGGYTCDANRLLAREMFKDAMGYPPPPETATSGLDTDSQLGSSGYVSLQAQTAAALIRWNQTLANLQAAKDGCKTLTDLSQGIVTNGGAPITVWKGAEDVVRQVDAQGTVGPVKTPAEATP